MSKLPEENDLQCLSCGAILKYTERPVCRCEYCGTEKILKREKPQLKSLKDYEQYIQYIEDDESVNTEIVTCGYCYISFRTDSLQTIECVNCGNSLKNVCNKKLIQASHYLPFTITDDKLKLAIRNWASFSLPPYRLSIKHELQLAYIPYWVYEIETTDMKKININASGVVGDGIGSWDLENLQRFDNNEKIAIEKYEITATEAFGKVREAFVSPLDILNDLGINNQEPIINSLKYKLVLLPLYIGRYNLHGSSYTFYLNGRTGKYTGPVHGKILTNIIVSLFGLLFCYLLFKLTSFLLD